MQQFQVIAILGRSYSINLAESNKNTTNKGLAVILNIL